MSTAAQPLNDLVAKVRSKYPGAYDDLDDAALTKAVLAKYPQYSDLAAPKMQKPSAQMEGDKMSFPEKVGANLADAYEHVKPYAQKAANDVYDVSAPGIAEQIGRKMQGKPNDLKQLPGKMVTAFATVGAPEGEAMPEARAAEAAPKYPGAPMPEAPTPELVKAQSLAKGPQSVVDPAAGLGKIPVSKAAESSIPVQKITPKDIERQLNEALGGQPLKPNVPLKQQVSTTPKPTVDAEGHTQVESSAVKSFKYDAENQEFHVKPNGGRTTYVYGEVSPDAAEAFNAAESKGNAWIQIRNNPLVAKIIDGKRIAVRPVPKPSEDLTGILQQSVEQARAARAR